ncbi:hypothetical protein BC936DRAFT_144070, partial [Jimgerdemannia flammicorona]
MAVTGTVIAAGAMLGTAVLTVGVIVALVLWVKAGALGLPLPRLKVSEKVRNEARRKMNLDCNCYNIAIVEQSGQGKSSVVNGLRGVDESDEDAAPVGEVQTTTLMGSYRHPLIPTVV